MGLYFHAYPNHYERMCSLGFIDKHFETWKKIKFETVEQKLKAMEGPCSGNLLKMTVLCFLCSVILDLKRLEMMHDLWTVFSYELSII